MANKEAFTAEEWALLRLAPSFVASGTSIADPSGLFATLKESVAGAQGVAETFRFNSGLELFAALAADRSLPSMPDAKTMLGEGPREQQMQNLKSAVLDRAKSAVSLVSRKASPAEADAYKTMLVRVAEKAANASKEGGFLGFGGVRVSDKEQAFITEVKRTVGVA
jgi:hypothetical protein